MKKIKKTKMSVIAGSIMSLSIMASAHAQLMTEQPVVGYSGTSFPQPSTPAKSEVKDLNSLMSGQILANYKKDKDNVSEMRKEALKEIALSLGASNGLAFRMNELKIQTDAKAAQLDKIFDFSKMTIDNGVLAPVLTEGLSNYAQSSDDQVRIADKIYKIESAAKFVSVYPTWRSYLRFVFPKFETPDTSYLPQNDTEKAVWDEAVQQGWKKGISQANHIYETSYARLERDYLGMIKYKILLAEGLITPTIIAKQNMGVTGGGKEMSINDQIFRITDHSALNPNNKQWSVEYPVTNKVDDKLK